jgi:hypothetical protein
MRWHGAGRNRIHRLLIAKEEPGLHWGPSAKEGPAARAFHGQRCPFSVGGGAASPVATSLSPVGALRAQERALKTQGGAPGAGRACNERTNTWRPTEMKGSRAQVSVRRSGEDTVARDGSLEEHWFCFAPCGRSAGTSGTRESRGIRSQTAAARGPDARGCRRGWRGSGFRRRTGRTSR